MEVRDSLLLLVKAKVLLRREGLETMYVDHAIEYLQRAIQSTKEIDWLIQNTLTELERSDKIKLLEDNI